MCTVSWWRRDGKLSVRFNRDEQRGRPSAELPQCTDGKIFPRDPQGGGTWICVDRAGTVHCLLNYYDAESPEPVEHPRSRGELPLLSADHSSTSFFDWLEPRAYPPFHLLRIPRTGNIEHMTWDSRHLQEGPAHPDLTHWTTSGWNGMEVVSARASLFQTMLSSHGLSEQTLEAFHFTSDPEQPGRWPRMSRPEARTVSYSEVRVDDEIASFRYVPLSDSVTERPEESVPVCCAVEK